MTVPIITSLLDTDHYKLTMGQFIFHRQPNMPVRYGFNCRANDIVLPDIIPMERLRYELDAVRNLRFTDEELEYLRTIPHSRGQLFQDDFLQFLSTMQLPPYKLSREGDYFRLEFPGPWGTATHWEIPALAIISQLYFQAITEGRLGDVYDEGAKRFMEKAQLLLHYPEIQVTDFGTRRRAHKVWQGSIVRWADHILGAQLTGVSNVLLAKEYGLNPVGTMAHELFMVYAAYSRATDGSDAALRASHHQVLEEWWDEYGEDLSVALTDTFGTDFFFREFTEEQARKWRGLRHDSGNPFEFGERTIERYGSYDIDPKEKVIVFSDGLDVGTITTLWTQFHDRINVSFGWGTNLTNDLGVRALPNVVKVIWANGRDAIKLSDNLAKAQGPPEEIAVYTRACGYTNTLNEQVRY